jgi:hypothetical protein
MFPTSGAVSDSSRPSEFGGGPPLYPFLADCIRAMEECGETVRIYGIYLHMFVLLCVLGETIESCSRRWPVRLAAHEQGSFE